MERRYQKITAFLSVVVYVNLLISAITQLSVTFLRVRDDY